MASKKVVASLLIEMGMDSADAEKSAKRLTKSLEKVDDAAKKVAKETKEADRALGKSSRAFDKAADKARKAARGIDKAAASARKFATAVSAMDRVGNAAGTAMKGVGVALGVVGGAVLLTGAKFEKLQVQLQTATGSADEATKAFAFIKEFTSDTPFQLDQVTDAFVKLKIRGLDPSRENLTAFGDMASAMGRDLDQVVEAVLDATTGEFERLKEFGVTASQQGKNVALTFKGVTTTVGKNAAEIQDFLVGISETNFSGAMANEMQTLGGRFSNLLDTLTLWLDKVANMGPMEEAKKLFQDLSKVMGDKTGGLAKTIADTLTKAIKGLRNLIKGDLIGILETAAKAVQLLVENFDILIALFAASKTISAFAAISTGFTSMGFAAAGALGPIGMIAGALLALLPIANRVGNALGDVLGKNKELTVGRSKGPISLEDLNTLPADLRQRAKNARKEITRLTDLQRKGGLSPGQVESINKQLRDPMAVTAEARAALNQMGGDASARAAARAKSAEAAKKQESRDEVSAALGGKPETAQEIMDRTGDFDLASQAGDRQAAWEAAQAALKRDPNNAAAAIAAANDVSAGSIIGGFGKGGGGGKKKSAAKSFKPPTTVSEFFGAASRGELGPIADRTPAVADIEPTVAVDITNNNFTFTDTFNITGVGNPKEVGEQVVMVIRREFDRRNSNAGQEMANNVVR